MTIASVTQRLHVYVTDCNYIIVGIPVVHCIFLNLWTMYLLKPMCLNQVVYVNYSIENIVTLEKLYEGYIFIHKPRKVMCFVIIVGNRLKRTFCAEHDGKAFVH